MWHLEATSVQFNNINDILNDEQRYLQSCRSHGFPIVQNFDW